MNSRRRLEKIKELINWVSNKTNLCIVFHRNADPDAVAAAIALKEIIQKTTNVKEVLIIAPEGIEVPSKKALSDIGLSEQIITSREGWSCNHYIVVDTSTQTQLAGISKALKPRNYVVIDHHEINDLVKDAAIAIHEPSTASTSEIIAAIAEHLTANLSKEVLTLLMVGILYDTKLLRLATPETLETMAWLMRKGGNYRKALATLTSRTISRSEKIAKLKGISRTGLYTLNKAWILAITCIGAHESAVLKTLIDAGADVAVAVAIRKGVTRITVRAVQDVIDHLGKPLAAELCRELGKRFGGTGGGHAGAAGALIESEINPEAIMEGIRHYFKSLGVSVKTLEKGRWMEECR